MKKAENKELKKEGKESKEDVVEVRKRTKAKIIKEIKKQDAEPLDKKMFVELIKTRAQLNLMMSILQAILYNTTQDLETGDLVEEHHGKEQLVSDIERCREALNDVLLKCK